MGPGYCEKIIPNSDKIIYNLVQISIYTDPCQIIYNPDLI
jgi:hypothetical protein